jgi:hypothetical protein
VNIIYYWQANMVYQLTFAKLFKRLSILKDYLATFVGDHTSHTKYARLSKQLHKMFSLL